MAVVGASDDVGKFGGRVIHYLQKHGFPGQLLPINPNRATIRGLPAFAVNEDCLACEKCVAVCPHQVIVDMRAPRRGKPRTADKAAEGIEEGGLAPAQAHDTAMHRL